MTKAAFSIKQNATAKQWLSNTSGSPLESSVVSQKALNKIADGMSPLKSITVGNFAQN